MAEPHDTITSIADSLEPDVRAIFLSAVAEAQLQVGLGDVAELLRQGRINDLLALLAQASDRHLLPALSQLSEPLRDALIRSGVQLGLIANVSFQLTNPRVLAFIREHSARLVTGITTQTLSAIRDVLFAGQFSGHGATAQARMIRPLIGLLPRHVKAVANFAAGLEGNPNAEVMVERYARRLLMWRANNISRTETIRAAVNGQYQLWWQQVDEGLLNPDRFRVVWIVTDDDRLCPWCEPLDGVTVEFGEQFVATKKLVPTSGGKDQFVPLARPIRVLHPPLHPQCRCAVALEF